ncbi:MAG: rRNA ((1939)-C(5))-methyltransferase RlmD [Burkholderiales bacterium]|jgi:23S rRNA (uracil1939-C5)-methyltransferase|nr:rRNA ((1939)-C(5))-methyltransferase RlmD [Burkholderiales bacterium]
MNKTAIVNIESVDIEGKGIARIDGKTIFIPGVLPGETVEIEIYKQKSSFDLARMLNIITPSKDRVIPKCPNFGTCGGCSLQHIEFHAQVRYKQQVLIDNLKHIGKVTAKNLLEPIYGTPWNYRHRARMSSRYVRKKESVLIGFREKASSYVVNMTECYVLPKAVSNIIPALRDLVSHLSIREAIPQIEIAVGAAVNVFVIRIMEKLSLSDEDKIRSFVDVNSTICDPIQIWLQPKGIDSSYPFYPAQTPALSYKIREYDIDMPYYPSEFTQVNPYINQHMIKQAITLLEPGANDIVFDFFCGIGNFTLPIATLVNKVYGIEGSEQLVSRANANAKHNKLDHKVNYSAANLFKIDASWLQNLGKADKWLIDPPRDGAFELIKAITPEIAPGKIVYVSCNPATLARDAEILVNEHGYKLEHAGVINMFPHTSHIESIAVFEK